MFSVSKKSVRSKGPLWEGAGTALAVTGGENLKVLCIYDIR